MKRIKIVFIILVFLITTIALVFVIKRYFGTEYIIDPKLHEYYIEDEVGREELVLEVAKKNNDWSRLPLSKKFRKEYNSKDGILGKVEFDTIELNHFKEGEKSYIGGTNHLYLKNGKQEMVYFYAPKYTYTPELFDIDYLDDVELIGPIYVSDENGKEMDFRFPFIDDYKIENLRRVVRGEAYNAENSVAVTDKFHKKYPFFLDLFIHYSPLSYNRIEFLEKESDLDNNIAIFEVNSILECKRRKYEVKLIFDDKMYLDDAEVKLVKEEDYKGSNENRTSKVTYKYSNWDNLKLTDNFKKKYNSKDGVFQDIDNVNIDISADGMWLYDNSDFDYIYCFTNKDDVKESYYVKYIEDNKGNLDDLKFERLPYINKTAAEVKELYLKEHNIEQ